jgi:hypothetical protein
MNGSPTEIPKPRKKKLIAVLMAAILGAVFSCGLILVVNRGGEIWGHGQRGDIGPAFFQGLAIILSIPAVSLSPFLDHTIFGNPYVVNGILSAFAFAAIAAFWQFIVKADKKN